jgi:hypothetical protein
MKPKLTKLAASIIITGLSAAGPALSTDMSSLPPVQAQGAVSYMTGGIGEDEAAAFKHAAAGFPLEMLFVQKARPNDEFLADVRVSVRDRSGNSLLETTAEGPFLLAKLPAGTYRIEAEYRGERKHQSVEIRSGTHRRAVFVWAPRDDSEGRVLTSAN